MVGSDPRGEEVKVYVVSIPQGIIGIYKDEDDAHKETNRLFVEEHKIGWIEQWEVT
jgi:hypothetical protein